MKNLYTDVAVIALAKSLEFPTTLIFITFGTKLHTHCINLTSIESTQISAMLRLDIMHSVDVTQRAHLLAMGRDLNW